MIRKMCVEDLAHVMAIENACFSSPWTLAEYEYELLENPFASLFVYEVDHQIIGMFDVWVTFEVAQIANIAIAPDFQGKGYGQQLMNELIDFCVKKDCENITLEVRISNESAISLYHKNNFVISHIRKNYYEDGEDAYLMMKELGGFSNE